MKTTTPDVERIRAACSETLVIALLRERPMHGYEMCKEIERRSQGYFALRHSTLYPLLHRLEQEGLVTSEWGELDSGKPRKSYQLTRKGRGHLRESVNSWRGLFSGLALLLPELSP